MIVSSTCIISILEMNPLLLTTEQFLMQLVLRKVRKVCTTFWKMLYLFLDLPSSKLWWAENWVCPNRPGAKIFSTEKDNCRCDGCDGGEWICLCMDEASSLEVVEAFVAMSPWPCRRQFDDKFGRFETTTFSSSSSVKLSRVFWNVSMFWNSKIGLLGSCTKKVEIWYQVFDS